MVRACTIVLGDWEKITTRALKSAVAILHRIAFGCKSPAMLYQVSELKNKLEKKKQKIYIKTTICA